MKLKFRIFIGLIILSAIGYFFINKDFNKTQNTIYINGNIITIEDNLPKAEAMLVKNGLIESIGTNEKVLSHNNNNITIVDLKAEQLDLEMQKKAAEFKAQGSEIYQEV